MKTIVITDKNYRWVFSKLKKFFDHENFVCWHQWGGGMRKRLGHIIEIHSPGYPAYKVDVTRQYHRVSSTVEETFDGDPLFRVSLNYDNALAIIPNRGIAVSFLGNRVIIKRYDKFSDRYLYECFQILK